jgi:putative endonuclease
MIRCAEGPLVVGHAKEELACRFLEARGLRLVARNFRCRRGEIDLIMRDRHCLVFVEVRYRRDARFGTAAESVDRGKQGRVLAAARYYLQRNPSDLACRFDVLAITGAQPIEWLRDAFQDG